MRKIFGTCCALALAVIIAAGGLPTSLVSAQSMEEIVVLEEDYHVPIADNDFQVEWVWDDDDEILTEVSRVDYAIDFENPRSRSVIIRDSEDDDMVLVTEIVYQNQYEEIIVERHYTDEASLRSALTRNASGTKNHKVEREATMASGAILRWWAQGSFRYNEKDNTVTVSSPSGNTNTVSGITISNKSTTTNTGGGVLVKKWAEVTFSFTQTASSGIKTNRSVSARVNSAGK